MMHLTPPSGPRSTDTTGRTSSPPDYPDRLIDIVNDTGKIRRVAQNWCNFRMGRTCKIRGFQNSWDTTHTIALAVEDFRWIYIKVFGR